MCESALTLFLAKGIESTTIDDITQKAGTAKGSFYRYFEDKTAIVETIFLPTFHAMKAALDTALEAIKQARSIDDLHRAYEGLAADIGWAIFAMPDVVLLYLQESRAPAVGARAPVRELVDLVVNKSIELTFAAREQGLLRPFPAEVSARAVIGAVEHLLYAVLKEEDVGDVVDIPGALASLVLDGLRAGKAPKSDDDAPEAAAESTSEREK